MKYVAYIEFEERGASPSQIEDTLDRLEDLEAIARSTSSGYVGIQFAVTAADLRAAIATALGIAEAAWRPALRLIEVLPEIEFLSRQNRQAGALLSTQEVADRLGTTRSRVNQMVADGDLIALSEPGGGRAVPLSSVQENELRSVFLGWSGIDIRDEHIREIVDPIYDALRIVGLLPSFEAAEAAKRNAPHNASFAEAWMAATADANYELQVRGYDTTAVSWRVGRFDRRRRNMVTELIAEPDRLEH